MGVQGEQLRHEAFILDQRRSWTRRSRLSRRSRCRSGGKETTVAEIEGLTELRLAGIVYCMAAMASSSPATLVATIQGDGPAGWGMGPRERAGSFVRAYSAVFPE